MRRAILVSIFTLLVVGSIGALRPASQRMAQMPAAWVDGGHPSSHPSAPQAAAAPDGTAGRRALLSLLRNREYDRLGHRLESQQTQFEADTRTERGLAETLDAFGIADPSLTPLLDEWVAHQPHAWAPRLARARHRLALAGDDGDDADETTTVEVRRATLHSAIEDANAALELNHRLALAYVTLIAATRASGDREASARYAGMGLAIAPGSVVLRVQHATGLLPRFGGSYAAVEAFAKASQSYAEQAPALRSLLGFADWDRGRVRSRQRQFAEALTFFDRAVATGDWWRFYRDRGETYVRMQRHAAALDDLDRAVALAPEDADVVTLRAEALAGLGRRSDALQAAQRATELDPTNHELAWFRRHGAEDAVAQGWDFIRTHDLRAAIERYTWADELAGGDAEARYWRGRAYLQRNDATHALADFEQAIRLDPHHVESYRRIDGILSQQKNWDAIARLWSQYIQLEPTNADGWVERSDAYRQKGDKSAALADAREACRLGEPASCDQATRSGHGG